MKGYILKYYAVRKGKQTGIYTNWVDCKEQVAGYSGAEFKAFILEAEAIAYMNMPEIITEIDDTLPYCYIDGTYSKALNLYGYGGFIAYKDNTYIIQGMGNNPDYIHERNIAGEILGTLKAIQQASILKIPDINIYYDYAGIGQWACGNWKAETKLAQYYRQLFEILTCDINVNFIKVKGHAGIEGNEIADLLAKEIIGAKLRKKDIALLNSFRDTHNICV